MLSIPYKQRCAELRKVNRIDPVLHATIMQKMEELRVQAQAGMAGAVTPPM